MQNNQAPTQNSRQQNNNSKQQSQQLANTLRQLNEQQQQQQKSIHSQKQEQKLESEEGVKLLAQLPIIIIGKQRVSNIDMQPSNGAKQAKWYIQPSRVDMEMKKIILQIQDLIEFSQIKQHDHNTRKIATRHRSRPKNKSIDAATLKEQPIDGGIVVGQVHQDGAVNRTTINILLANHLRKAIQLAKISHNSITQLYLNINLAVSYQKLHKVYSSSSDCSVSKIMVHLQRSQRQLRNMLQKQFSLNALTMPTNLLSQSSSYFYNHFLHRSHIHMQKCHVNLSMAYFQSAKIYDHSLAYHYSQISFYDSILSAHELTIFCMGNILKFMHSNKYNLKTRHEGIPYSTTTNNHINRRSQEQELFLQKEYYHLKNFTDLMYKIINDQSTIKSIEMLNDKYKNTQENKQKNTNKQQQQSYDKFRYKLYRSKQIIKQIMKWLSAYTLYSVDGNKQDSEYNDKYLEEQNEKVNESLRKMRYFQIVSLDYIQFSHIQNICSQNFNLDKVEVVNISSIHETVMLMVCSLYSLSVESKFIAKQAIQHNNKLSKSSPRKQQQVMDQLSLKYATELCIEFLHGTSLYYQVKSLYNKLYGIQSDCIKECVPEVEDEEEYKNDGKAKYFSQEVNDWWSRLPKQRYNFINKFRSQLQARNPQSPQQSMEIGSQRKALSPKFKQRLMRSLQTSPKHQLDPKEVPNLKIKKLGNSLKNYRGIQHLVSIYSDQKQRNSQTKQSPRHEQLKKYKIEKSKKKDSNYETKANKQITKNGNQFFTQFSFNNATLQLQAKSRGINDQFYANYLKSKQENKRQKQIVGSPRRLSITADHKHGKEYRIKHQQKNSNMKNNKNQDAQIGEMIGDEAEDITSRNIVKYGHKQQRMLRMGFTEY